MQIGASEAMPWSFSISSADEWISRDTSRASAAPAPDFTSAGRGDEEPKRSPASRAFSCGVLEVATSCWISSSYYSSYSSVTGS